MKKWLMFLGVMCVMSAGLVGCSATELPSWRSDLDDPTYGYGTEMREGLEVSGGAQIEVSSFEQMMEHSEYRADTQGRVHGYGEVGTIDKDFMEETKKTFDEMGREIKDNVDNW